MRAFLALWSGVLTIFATYLGLGATMHPRTVALLSHTGQVGTYFLHYLHQEHVKGSINLVVLHRDGSNLSSIPEGVEKRVVQLDDGGARVNEQAVKGVEVVVSAISREARLAQIPLIEALSSSSSVQLFIPSDYDLDWTPEGTKAPHQDLLQVKRQVYAAAQDKGVPYVEMYDGVFDNYFFEQRLAGVNIVNNTMKLFLSSLHHPTRIATLDYFGYAISQLVLEPSKIVGRNVQLYDFAPTGQELVDVLTKIHEVSTTVIDYTEKEYRHDRKSDDTVVSAGIQRKWRDNDWGTGEKVEVAGWKEKTLEDLVKSWKKKL